MIKQTDGTYKCEICDVEQVNSSGNHLFLLPGRCHITGAGYQLNIAQAMLVQMSKLFASSTQETEQNCNRHALVVTVIDKVRINPPAHE